LFVDDSLILIRANGENATHLQGILDLYEECSEHAINKEKPAMIFSKNTESKKKAAVMQALNLTHETFNDKYFGLTIHVRQSRTETFEYLNDIGCAQRVQG